MHLKKPENEKPSKYCENADLTLTEPRKPVRKRKKKTKKKRKAGKDKSELSQSCSKKSLLKDTKSAKSGQLTTCSMDDLEAAQESKSVRIIRPAKAERVAEQLKMMFTSSIDPMDKPLRWWEQEHVKYSFTYSPVRSRLEYLMGSNVVRLTDRKYMLKLMARIRQDHEAKQEARIQERKKQELMRTKNMILNRFIPVEEAPAEIFRYPLFQLYMYCDSIMERRCKKRMKKVKLSQSLYRLLYPETACVEENTEDTEEQPEEVPMKEVFIDGEPTLVPLTRDEIEAIQRDKEIAEDIKKGYMLTKEEYENLHYEADAIKKLKETRTVNEMYEKAHEIVGMLYSLAGEPRKRCTQDLEMLESAEQKLESASEASKGSKSSKASKASKATKGSKASKASKAK